MNKYINGYFIAFLFLLFLILFSFRQIVFSNKTYFSRDLQGEHFPARLYTAESLIKGEIPLWNPYSSCGIPFMANMVSAVWYPLNIIFYLFNFPLALTIYYVLIFSLSAFSAYLLSKQCGLHTTGALIIGILFSLNGFMMTKLEFLSNVGAALWLPMMILMRFSPILLGILFSFAFFAGSNQQIIYQIIGIIIFYIILKKYNLSLWMGLIYSGIYALLISLIQFLPSLELYLQSNRFIEGFYQTVTALKLKDFIGLFMPYLLEPHKNLIFGEKVYWAHGMYIGIAAGFVAFYGFLNLKFKQKLLYCFLLILFVIISLGNNFPLFFNNIYKNIPFLSAFRYPSTISYLIIFLLILLILPTLKKIKLGYNIIIFVLIFIEISILNYNHLPIMGKDIYYFRGPVIKYLQSQNDRYRYQVTPDYYLYTQSSSELMFYYAHDSLYGNIGMPYHLYNSSGFENLPALKPFQWAKNINEIKNKDDFYKKIAFAGIKHIIITHDIDEKLQYIQFPKWANIIINPYVTENQKPKRFYYSGWKAYYKGKRIPVFADKEGWMSVPEAYEDRNVKYLYAPFTYKIGLLVTLITIFFIIIRFYLYLLGYFYRI